MIIPVLTYGEHVGFNEIEIIDSLHSEILKKNLYTRKFQKFHKGKKQDLTCFKVAKVRPEEDFYQIESNYFIGIDWILEGKLVVNIQPKINNNGQEVDYLKMLLDSVRHPETMDHLDNLFEVYWDEPKITISQKNDFLTPFLLLEFLGLLRQIVKKGLRKSYFRVEKNLYSRVKGKILVGKTIKHNAYKNKMLHTYCSFQEFGVDNLENKLLKKALQFAKFYLSSYNQLIDTKGLLDLYNFINPAFEKVSTEVDIRKIKDYKSNRFFKEYDEALRLAKMIFERFGYNISSIAKKEIETPPFWIDMSRLFEIYVLALLKDVYGSDVEFQFEADRNNHLDYLLNSKDEKFVIDAKYKPKYINTQGKEETDIRQVSGYARLKKVYKELYGNEDFDKIISGLIIYPDQNKGIVKIDVGKLKSIPIKPYIDIFKLGIKLPVIN
ncbi:hypothetical protein [Salegentibacter sp. Hel_I_6]|uniref:5-methylcytosine restriction system specificity protein McrC n=1 Tax=Salegentibacter sp. Hel_I_6 TaxID=1250278 RepID=UPI000692329B|nr:hypothetical protein [Salegentibacter sp. Hel_I_6]